MSKKPRSISNVTEVDKLVMVIPESVTPPLGHIPVKPRIRIGPIRAVFTEIWGLDRAGEPNYFKTAVKVPSGSVYRGYRIEELNSLPEVVTDSVAPNAVILMATPVQDGLPLIGAASHVCITLWGTTKSGAPCNISVAIHKARNNAEYNGYNWRVLPEMPDVVQSIN